MNTYAHIITKGLRILHPVAYLINDILRGLLYRGGGGKGSCFIIWNPPAVEKNKRRVND